jgi:hypothetical protein
MQKLILIGGLSSCLQVYAMQPVTEPIATYNVGFNEKLEITPSLVQDQGHEFLVIAAARHEADRCIERSRSSLDLSTATMPVTPKVMTVNKADKNIGTEENNDKNDKDETLSASSEHFSAEVEVGKKGSWFHCKTHCKSKTIAKYMATAGSALLAGLLL